MAKTMTASQMAWAFKKGFAWHEQDGKGNVCDEWYHPIWTRQGCFMWDVGNQRYEMV